MLLYSFAIALYGGLLHLAASLGHPKAKAWVAGRRNWEARLRAAIQTEGPPWVWIHCASLGEFEQGRPLIDYLHDNHPEWRLLVTFFSDSGFRIRQHYPKAHHVAFLPLDLPGQARRFLSIVNPAFGVFVKYELWLNTLAEARHRNIPLLLIAARPKAESPAFRWPLRGLYRKGYASFAHIFAQDTQAEDTLRSLGLSRVSVGSDPRYDRVAAGAAQWTEVPGIRDFLRGRPCIVAGSTWPQDEALLLPAWQALPPANRPCLIIAPHEIHKEKLRKLTDESAGKALLYSELSQLSDSHEVLWIDNVGMLSRLYAYAKVAYVGGAFGSGLHNILEAAVFGCPLLFGPKYQAFPEAEALVASGGAVSVKTREELQQQLAAWLGNTADTDRLRIANRQFVEEKKGATDTIIRWITAAGWLKRTI